MHKWLHGGRWLCLRDWSVTAVMHGSFLIVVVVPILLVSLLSYQSYKSIIIEQSTQRTLQTLRQVSLGIDREASQIVNTAQTLYRDAGLMTAAGELSGRTEPAGGLLGQHVRDKVQSYYHYTKELISVVYFYRNGGSFSTRPDYGYNEKELRSSIWYNKALAQEGKILLFGVQAHGLPGSDIRYANTAAIAVPPDAPGGSGVELIYFVYRGTLFQQLFESASKESGTFVILDTEYRVMAANREAYIQNWPDQPPYLYKTSLSESGEYTETVDRDKAYVTFVTAPDTRFKVIHMIPYSVLTAPLQKVFLLAITIGAGVLLLFLLVSWSFAGTITRPVKNLVREMSKMRKGSFHSDFQPAGPSEVYVLGTRFLAMMREMDELIHEKEEQQRAKSIAELRALQSQINPHFMLNTLNAIKLMAVISKTPNIRDMTDAFIRLLSSTFNRGGTMHSVRDECGYLEQYFYIMKFRYGHCEVKWDMEEQVKDCRMLKLLLQPIVENAIVHGLQHRESEGRLCISGKAVGGKLVFRIEDNGIGMDGEEVGALLADPGMGFSGIGIRNVHERIRLHYGDAYGLSIASRTGEGTRVEVSLPLIQAGTEEQGPEEESA